MPDGLLGMPGGVVRHEPLKLDSEMAMPVTSREGEAWRGVWRAPPVQTQLSQLRLLHHNCETVQAPYKAAQRTLLHF